MQAYTLRKMKPNQAYTRPRWPTVHSTHSETVLHPAVLQQAYTTPINKTKQPAPDCAHKQRQMRTGQAMAAHYFRTPIHGLHVLTLLAKAVTAHQQPNSSPCNKHHSGWRKPLHFMQIY
jgi:hypothetical protein